MTDGSAAGFRLLAYTDAVTLGGAEICLGNVLAELSAEIEVHIAGIDATVVDHLASMRPESDRWLLPAPRSENDLLSIVRHRRLFRQLRPDVIHINLRMPFACQPALVAALLTRGARVVAVEHLPMDIGRRFRRRLKRAISARLDDHIAVSSASARQVETHAGLPAGSVATIPNGVPIVDHPSSPRLASRFTIGAVGRLDPQKGFDVAVDALVAVPDAALVIVGEGPEREGLERRAESAGVGGRVVFTGHRPDARALLPAFDVVVVPSRFEGAPLVVIEAMQAGVPVVASDVGGTPELIRDGETGILVPPDDPDALAEALQRVRDDAALGARLATAARRVAVSRHTAAAMAGAYERHYRATLARPNRLRVAAYTDATAWGGAEECLATILGGLSDDVAVTVLGPSEHIVAEIATRRPGSSARLVPPVRSSRDLRRLVGLTRAIRAVRPDVVHVNLRAPFLSQHSELAAVLSRAPAVALEHSMIGGCSRLRRVVKRATLGRLSACVSPSRAGARWLETELGLAHGSVRTIHNGVAARGVTPVAALASGPVIGSIGRIEREKGYDVMIDALAALPATTAVLVGAGSRIDELRRQAETLGLADRVVFTGWVDDALAYLAGFDVFVLPSRAESFPLTTLEAMQAGIPVVATDVGGVGEAIVDGVNGRLVPPEDPAALTQAVRWLLENPDQRERLVEEGRRLARTEFTAERMANEYERLYREVARR
jgi:glycosyltransferase involved in cell wall biosynthesis